VGVDVGEGVLGLAVLGEDTGGDLVDLGDEVEHGVVGKVLEGELALADVTRVGLAEDGVAVTGNDTAGLEGVPEVLLDVLVCFIWVSQLRTSWLARPWRGPARPLRPAARER
jgi:hypothetical protein